MSERIGDGIPLVGIGIVGLVHEFAMSSGAELLPVVLFGLLVVKGVLTLAGKE